MQTQTAYEVAEEFRCSAAKVRKEAAKHGIGVNLEGRAGWRFTEAEKVALWEAMRPKKVIAPRRRRRVA